MRFCFAGTLVTALFMALFVACGDGAADGGTSCGFETQAAECRRLCDNACTRTARCGLDQATCTTDCVRAYSCPAETPGQDDAICRLELARLPALCADLCVWTATFGVRPRDSGAMCSARAWQSFAITEGGNRPRSWLVL